MCLEDIPFILLFAQRKWIWLARKCDEILRNLMNERSPSGNKLFPLINDDVTYNLTPFYPNQHCLKQTTPAYYFLESGSLCVNDSMKTGSFIYFHYCTNYYDMLNVLIDIKLVNSWYDADDTYRTVRIRTAPERT